MANPDQGPVQPQEVDLNLADLREVSAERARARIAAELYQARQRRGESLHAVAEFLRIRYAYLVAIEEGRFEDLPGPAYVLGFLRSYATHLGLEADEIIARFKAEASQFAAPQKLEFPLPADEGHLPTIPVLVGALVLAAAVYWGWDYLSTADRVQVERITPVPARLAEEPQTPEIEGEPSADNVAESVWSPRTISIGAIAPWLLEPQATGVPPSARGQRRAPLESGPGAIGRAEGERPEPEMTATEGGEVYARAVPWQVEPVVPGRDEERTMAAVGSGTAPAETAAESGGSEAAAALPFASEPPPADVAAPALAPLPEGTVAEPEIPTATLMPIDEETLPSAEPALEPATGSPAVSTATEGVRGGAPRPEDAAEASAAPAQPLVTSTSYVPRIYGRGNTDSRIQVRARFDSWVQVKGAGGDLLITRILWAGDVYYVPNRPGLVMHTGNAGALEIMVDGMLAPPLGPLGAVRKDIALDPETLLAGTAVSAEGASTEPP